MPKNIKVKLNRAGAAALLNGPEAVADMGRRASAVAAACGPGYVGDGQAGKTRAHGMARTDNVEAILDNLKTNKLLKNLGRGA
ncbi:MAG: hypothetical protein ACTII7_07780 [Galactobacter sp.]